MIRMLVRGVVSLAAAAIGLIVAMILVDGMTITASGFVLVVVIFAVLQAVLAPFLIKVTARNTPALLGAAGLITTFIALLITSVVSDGLTITGAGDWVLATLCVWLVTMIAALLLPWVLLKLGIEAARDRRSTN